MNMRIRISGMMCLAVCVAVSLVPAASGAVITVDYDAGDFPTSADALTVTDYEWTKDTKAGKLYAQTFTLPTGPEPSFQLEEIILGRTDQTNNVSYTLRLFAVADVNAEALTPVGADLINESLTTIGAFSNTSTVKYTLSGAPLLLDPSVTDSGKTSGYAVMFDSANTSGYGIKLLQQIDDAYTGGAAYESGDAMVSGTRDFMLAINGMYVPEPATMSLLALGGLAALIRRRSV